MKFWFVRAGIEKKLQNQFIVRFGITNPVIAETSSLGNLRAKLPNPKFSASCGIGYEFKHLKLDAALSFNPGLSYVKHKPVPTLYISSIFRY
jgi:hypothetical protein